MILVVDSDPGVVTGLTQELDHCFGRDYQFLQALSAQSGLGILEQLGAAGKPVALVIAGLQLPDMPGPEFLSRVCGPHPQAKRALLVHLQEFWSSRALHRAMALGRADAWLTKPWAIHDQFLYAQVSILLSEWHEDSGRLQFVGLDLIGEEGASGSRELRDILDRHALPYRFTAADSVEGRELLREAGRGTDRLPVLIRYGGPVLVQADQNRGRGRARPPPATGHPAL